MQLCIAAVPTTSLALCGPPTGLTNRGARCFFGQIGPTQPCDYLYGKGDAGVLLVSKTALEPAIGPLALPSPEAGIGAHPHLGQSGPRLGLPGLSQKRALGAGNAEAA